MKGKITLQVLQAFGDGAMQIADCIEAVIRAGYGASQGKISREHRLIREQRVQTGRRRQEQLRAYNFLSYLRRDGLIEEERGAGRKLIRLTRRGRARMKDLIERSLHALPSPRYEPEQPSGAATIIVFDIPERERHKRVWLRSALGHLRFRMIQKSVWFGSAKLPREFLRDLAMLHMTDYVEIFQTTRAGTLRHII